MRSILPLLLLLNLAFAGRAQSLPAADSSVVFTVTKATPANAKTFTFVEQMPEFPGGDKALTDTLQSRMIYPQMEKDNHITGTVIIRFVVDMDGSVSDVEVGRSVSPGLDKEAVRLVKNLQRFSPGRQQGKAVRTYYSVPVVFRLN